MNSFRLSYLLLKLHVDTLITYTYSVDLHTLLRTQCILNVYVITQYIRYTLNVSNHFVLSSKLFRAPNVINCISNLLVTVLKKIVQGVRLINIYNSMFCNNAL